MKKTVQPFFPLLAMCLFSGAIFLIINLVYPNAPLSADTPLGLTRTITSPSQQTCSIKPTSGDTCSGEIPSGCTVFTVSKGDRVFFGGNDDYINPDSYYWVDPGGTQGYGAIWIGTPDNVQQGVNAKGLAYDANGLPRVDVNPHLERRPVLGGYTSYPIQILRECATVEEVIEWVNTHQWHSFMHDQLHFADATGDAVIISAGADGEVVFTRKPKVDSYLVSTNFNVANPSNGYYPCWRYETAQDLLSKLVNQKGELTYQDATNVLDAVHVEGGASWTIESMVADLPNGIVYLYYFHQFDEPVVLNIAEEIASAPAGKPLSDLFPEEIKQEAARRYYQIQSQKSRFEVLGKAWLGLVLASLVTLLIGSFKQRRGLLFWIPVVVIMGPLGLLIWLAAGRKRRVGNWQEILVETAGDVNPTIVAFVTVAVALVLLPWATGSSLLPLLLFFSLPLIIGLFVFQGPLLSFASKKGYLKTLLQRIPHTWVTVNLGMAGIFAIATPLVNMSLQLPLPSWTVVAWWGFTVMSALVAMLLLLPYESWSVRRGYRAWTMPAYEEGQVNLAPWRKLWWWILLSFLALIGGVASYVYIQQVILR
jgi:choloylglycine hydrolase